MSNTCLPNALKPLFLKLSPEHIVLLKFILESYEGLGELRTINAETGEVVLLTVSDMEPTAICVLAELAGSIGLRQISPPKSLENDWLLGEEL